MGGCRTWFDEEWHDLTLCQYSRAKQVMECEIGRACCMHVRDDDNNNNNNNNNNRVHCSFRNIGCL